MHLTAIFWFCTTLGQAGLPPASLPDEPAQPSASTLPQLQQPTLAPRLAGPAESSLRSTEPVPERAPPAALLLRQALVQPGRLALPGQPIRLRSALDRVVGSPQQFRTVAAYWRASETLAAYHFALAESELLQSMPDPQAAHQQKLLRAAQASAKAAESEARSVASEAQYDLAELAQLASNVAPLPADLPLTGPYRTHYEVFAARGLASASLLRLDRSLPLVRESLEGHALAALAAEEALTALGTAYEQGQASLETVLEGCDRLRRHRRAFLETVRNYNEQISRYALAVAGPNVSLDRLVSMLIEAPEMERSVLASKRTNGIQRVSSDDALPNPPLGQRPHDR